MMMHGLANFKLPALFTWCCCILVKVQTGNDCMKYLRHFRLYSVIEYFLKWATHMCVM